MAFCGIGKGYLDILDGSPPCQGFSMAGRRKVADERNDLYREFSRLIEGLRPKAFVMENVPSMASGRMKGRFIEIMETLKSMPYAVRCKMMNAKHYGVPQSRTRLIFVGVRKDLSKDPVYPNPERKLVSVNEALSQVKREDDLDFNRGINWGQKTLKRLYFLEEGQNLSKTYKNRSHFNYVLINRRRPLPTMCKSLAYSGCLGLFIKDKSGKIRSMTVNELKVCCSFPQDFVFPVLSTFRKTYENAINIMGNSVPPKLMESIAECIKRSILD